MTKIITELETKRNEKNALKYYSHNHQGQLKFNHHLVKEEILKEVPILRTDIGLLRYENGVYVRSTTGDIKHIIQKKIGTEATISRKNEILDLISHEYEAIPLSDFNKNDKVLNLKNGVYDLKKDKLIKHSPRLLSTNQISAFYNPEAKCPNILEFLHDVFDEETVEFIIEWIAYCSLPTTSPDKILILKGSGGEGKSALLNIISNFLGAVNTSGLSLHDLAEDKFARAQLYGKMANICGDIDSRGINGTGIIKNITGSEAVQAQFKGVDSFTFVPYAKLMFSANKMPNTNDISEGWDRRPIIVPFNKRVPKEKRVSRTVLDARLTSQEEMSGLLNLVIQAIKKLEKNDYQITNIPEESKRELEKYKLQKNPLSQFIKLNCDTTPKKNGDKMKWTDFYACYSAWYYDEHNKSTPKSKNQIKQEMLDKGYSIEIGAGNNYWLNGLSLLPSVKAKYRI